MTLEDKPSNLEGVEAFYPGSVRVVSICEHLWAGCTAGSPELELEPCQDLTSEHGDFIGGLDYWDSNKF